jgi:ABC-type multidrug transport system ATPase subunit
MTSAITATGLRKSFGGKAVLDGIDLEVGAGTMFSLLGPNGAGKTTTVQIMSTLVHADGGEMRVAGHDVARDPAAVRAAIGVTGQFSAVDNLLTGEENLLLWRTCTTWAGRKGGGAPPGCSTSSTWPTRPGRPRRPTPAACGGGSIWQ